MQQHRPRTRSGDEPATADDVSDALQPTSVDRFFFF
ncbi:unnamed protein product, partial [Ixodes persulcatus]